MGDTSIEWTEKTWNPTRGCSRVSPGCEHCYAETMGGRQVHMARGRGIPEGQGPYDGLVRLGKHGPRWTGKMRIPDALDAPLHWKKPRKVFVNSMSDLFHEKLTNEEVAAVFGVMAACPQHTFQLLTKRAERMREWFQWVVMEAKRRNHLSPVHLCSKLAVEDYLPHGTRISPPAAWPLPWVWLGVSVEDQQRADERIPHLLATPAAVRFVSAEPLLGPVDFERIQWPGKHRVDVLRGGTWEMPTGLVPPPEFTNHSDMATIDWVIVGGESGPGARPFNITWARSVIAQCKAAGVACFVKQLGAQPVVHGAAEEDGWGPYVRFEEDAPDAGPCRVKLTDRKGGDINEWPSDLRVRNFPVPCSQGGRDGPRHESSRAAPPGGEVHEGVG